MGGWLHWSLIVYTEKLGLRFFYPLFEVIAGLAGGAAIVYLFLVCLCIGHVRPVDRPRFVLSKMTQNINLLDISKVKNFKHAKPAAIFPNCPTFV